MRKSAVFTFGVDAAGVPFLPTAFPGHQKTVLTTEDRSAAASSLLRESAQIHRFTQSGLFPLAFVKTEYYHKD
ncbi:MAG TPA: hypothetical protein VGB38_05385 [bacterium]